MFAVQVWASLLNFREKPGGLVCWHSGKEFLGALWPASPALLLSIRAQWETLCQKWGSWGIMPEVELWLHRYVYTYTHAPTHTYTSAHTHTSEEIKVAQPYMGSQGIHWILFNWCHWVERVKNSSGFIGNKKKTHLFIVCEQDTRGSHQYSACKCYWEENFWDSVLFFCQGSNSCP